MILGRCKYFNTVLQAEVADDPFQGNVQFPIWCSLPPQKYIRANIKPIIIVPYVMWPAVDLGQVEYNQHDMHHGTMWLVILVIFKPGQFPNKYIIFKNMLWFFSAFFTIYLGTFFMGKSKLIQSRKWKCPTWGLSSIAKISTKLQLLVALLSWSSTMMMCEGGTRQCLLWQEGADPPPDPRDPRYWPSDPAWDPREPQGLRVHPFPT